MLLGAVLGAAAARAIPTITATGNKFFDSNGKQFFMKGMCGKARGPGSLAELFAVDVDMLLTHSLSQALRTSSPIVRLPPPALL